MKVPHILVVDDEPDIRNLLREILEDEGYRVVVAENVEHARRERRRRRPDLILLDIWMPDVDGITLLREWSRDGVQDVPVIMISGHGNVETAVEATRLGAYDFLEKPLSLAKLLLTVGHALEMDRLQRENRAYKRQLISHSEPLGSSEMMQVLREQALRIAKHDAWVLLSGEPGCELETVARFMHKHSARADGAYVSVRAAAISDEKSVRELFGSEEGGQLHYGLLEQANGGTLFFAEVADMDLSVQAKLNSVLANRALVRVGGSDEVALDVRIIAASHKSLEQEVAAGRFRGDLLYRLNVLPLMIPPLRHHSDDIMELLNSYMEQLAEQDGLAPKTVTPDALERLRCHDWPGNLSELRNLAQRLLILAQGEQVSLADVEFALGGGAVLEASVPAEFMLPLREARAKFEKAYFEYQLRQGDGNVGQIARRAGIERTHLYRKLRALGIKSTRGDEEGVQG